MDERLDPTFNENINWFDRMMNSLTKGDVTQLDKAENVSFLATARMLALRAEEHIREREARKIMEEKSKASSSQL